MNSLTPQQRVAPKPRQWRSYGECARQVFNVEQVCRLLIRDKNRLQTCFTFDLDILRSTFY